MISSTNIFRLKKKYLRDLDLFIYVIATFVKYFKEILNFQINFLFSYYTFLFLIFMTILNYCNPSWKTV